MKCEKCGAETSFSYKPFCPQCFKKHLREMEDKAYLEAQRAGNAQNDLYYAEDSDSSAEANE